ncbi:hypothetical protein AYO44_07515 [Planctomycetaceae bacterium SCGC AG-212-F19]|nr:hypothetical protein AYO44_07515 [Planctomycetaceae bacterium SCGC AG-212-F19]
MTLTGSQFAELSAIICDTLDWSGLERHAQYHFSVNLATEVGGQVVPFRDVVDGWIRWLQARELLAKFVSSLRGERPKNERLRRFDETVILRGLPQPKWAGSPFPGLRAFTTADAPIYYGRRAETAALLRKLSETNFAVVVGSSGSGKSSLVGAGLIPQLKGDTKWWVPFYSLEARQWVGLRLTPSEVDNNPYSALAGKLAPFLNRRLREVADALEADSTVLDECLRQINPDVKDSLTALLFIDQFEELFVSCAPRFREPFALSMEAWIGRENLRAVLTLRADFYQYCIDIPPLARLLERGTFPLAAPRRGLLEMIRLPAEQAGLEFEEGLVDEILHDAGTEPGTLALLAYTLDELYRKCGETGQMTREAYEALGGVGGAIRVRAEEAFASLTGAEQAAFGRVFGELVSVDESATATRRRAPLRSFKGYNEANRLITVFADKRLLTVSEEREPVVEVAHEAIFRTWRRLEHWIHQEQDDLILLRQIRQAAALWASKGRLDAYLWMGERLKDARVAVARKSPTLNETEFEFLRSEVDRLMDVVNDARTGHFQRSQIGDRLDLIGDTRPGVGLSAAGLPDILWHKVSEGTETLLIAKYPVTYTQYLCFVRTRPGGKLDGWEQYRQTGNCPADCISYEHAGMFCNWLASQVGYSVRLPTMDEWARAAKNKDHLYPWGVWEPDRANTSESRLSRTTAVGMYPRGACECGALDMSGNVWEWTSTPGPQGDDHFVCGGSWLTGMELAATDSRRPQRDTKRANNIGFRPVAIHIPKGR